MMYRCHECGELFDEPAEYREDMNGEGMYQTFTESPCCHQSYDEVYECDACGVEYAESGHEYCSTCERDLELLLNEVKTSMSIDESTLLDMLSDYIERSYR